MDWREELYPRLSHEAAECLRMLDAGLVSEIEEIRFRTGCEIEIVAGGQSCWRGHAFDEKMMKDLLAALSGYALYSCEKELSEGYVPLPGGHRAGVCGKMGYSKEEGIQMREITSVCLRIARWIPDASARIQPWLFDGGRLLSVLILGPPGCGKTTVLRSCALYLGGKARQHVAVIDERNEFFGGKKPVDGYRLDVLCGLSKSIAMPMLIRSMAPQAIVVDEIGDSEDTAAIRDAVRCGVAVFGSAHAASMRDMMCRPTLRRIYEEGAFDRYVLLGWKGAVKGIWEKNGKCCIEME